MFDVPKVVIDFARGETSVHRLFAAMVEGELILTSKPAMFTSSVSSVVSRPFVLKSGQCDVVQDSLQNTSLIQGTRSNVNVFVRLSAGPTWSSTGRIPAAWKAAKM